WSCFCAKHDCSPQYEIPCTGSAQLTTGCGLRQITVQTIGGPERWVYDQSGTLVGEQLGTDDSEFLCPTDPSMIGFVLRAGQFPDSCDSQLAADALTISWACYCQQYDCASQPERSCGSSGYGQWTRGCGLDEYSFMTVGGPERHVYDQSGQLVGAQTSSDTTPFSCPTDSNLVSSSLRAGQFADTCDGAVTCVCDGDAGSCGTPEAGVINPL